MPFYQPQYDQKKIAYTTLLHWRVPTNHRVKPQILVPESQALPPDLMQVYLSSAASPCPGFLPAHPQISQGRNCYLFVLTLDTVLWTHYNFYLFVLFQTMFCYLVLACLACFVLSKLTLNLQKPPVSASRMLRLQVCVFMSGLL